MMNPLARFKTCRMMLRILNRNSPSLLKSLFFPTLGPNYIRNNQTTLYPMKERERFVIQQTKDIISALKKHLTDRKDRRNIPSTAKVFNVYYNHLQAHLFQRYFTPLPLIDQLRARRELKLVKSIRRKLEKYHLILRQTDKSGVLHIGRKKDYIEKAMKYRADTCAYEELTDNPFNEIFFHVVQLLNKLCSVKRIKEPQKNKMMPNRLKTQLPYMYFLPKPHKVCSSISFYLHEELFYRKEHHFDRSSIPCMQQPLVFQNS